MFNDNVWSIYIQSDIDEDHEAWPLLQRFPQAGTHDSGNYIFVSSIAAAVDPLVVSEITDDNGDPMTGFPLVAEIGKEMIKPVRSRAIHINKSEAVELNKSPTWRIWTHPYGEDRAAFEADYNAVKAVYESEPRSGDLVIPAFSSTTTQTDAAQMLFIGLGNL